MACVRQTILALTTLTLVACTSTSNQIASRLTLCCPGDYDSYRSYSLQTENMPGFLSRYVVIEFDAAMSEIGLNKSTGNADLLVTLNYNQVNLNSDQEEIDPFMRNESLTTELTYIAAIDIEFREPSGGDPVWAGSVSRTHRVVPGEYMHQEFARPAFRRAFRSLLSNYPAPAPVE